MIAGHFGFAAMVKAREQATPLWALMLATAWLDVIFVPLYLAHIETLEPATDAQRAYGGSIIHAEFTHSLVGAVLLSMLLGAFAFALWGRRSAFIVALVAFSHWALDLVVHRADLPLLPGNLFGLPKLGFGLWRFPLVSSASELALVLLGGWLYWRASQKVAARAGRGARLSVLVSSLIVVFGVAILALDVSS
jgi:membrane-bound metal-dependent hydrolase YbcI (DUF457 family)